MYLLAGRREVPKIMVCMEKIAITGSEAACGKIFRRRIERQHAGIRFLWVMRVEEWLVSHE